MISNKAHGLLTGSLPFKKQSELNRRALPKGEGSGLLCRAAWAGDRGVFLIWVFTLGKG